jgi:hypothetical protein
MSRPKTKCDTYFDVAYMMGLKGDMRFRYLLFMYLLFDENERLFCRDGFARGQAENFLQGKEYKYSVIKCKRVLQKIDFE